MGDVRDAGAIERPGGVASGVSLRTYLSGVRDYRLLTREDEVRLGSVIEAGRLAAARLDQVSEGPERQDLERQVDQGRQATHEFITSNLRLVVAIARRYRSDSLSLLDLIQEGNLGLMTAVERFDHRRGFKFSTYARYWIHQAITKAVAEHGQPVRVPVQVMDLAWRTRRTQSRLETERGRTARPLDVAEELGLTEKHVGELLGYLDEPRSLSALLPDHAETMAGTSEDRPSLHDQVVDAVLPGAIRRLLDELDDRERDILSLHFGLDGNQPCTLSQIGAKYGVSRERIRQIEARALQKLRTPADPEARTALALVAG